MMQLKCCRNYCILISIQILLRYEVVMMTSEKTMVRDLTIDSVFRLLIIFSIPIMLANTLQIVYNIVDMAVVGNFLGTAGVSAVSAAGDMLLFFTTFSIGICSAGQVIISQLIGKMKQALSAKRLVQCFRSLYLSRLY